MTTALQTLTSNLSRRFELNGNEKELIDTLKNTAFRQSGKKYQDSKGNWIESNPVHITDDQMMALLIISNQFGLNPWTKEIYAFPDKGNGITPIVGIDGWSRIMNDHPQFDGIEFEQDAESCTCRIYRKDRSRPTSVTEYGVECQRNTDPWRTHPKRMLRHKAMIQCARLAFGFTGIYDQDEAERIVENEKQPINVTPKNTIDTTSVELATDEQIQRITELAEITNTPIEKILAFVGKQSLNELPKFEVEKVLNKLNATLNKQESEREQAQQSENLGQEIPL